MANEELAKSKLYRGFEVFGNIFVLNILFVICSLPIITIGASLTALYSVTIKMVKGEEGAIVKSFFRGFKSNFKKATILWLFVLIVLVVLTGEYIYIANFSGPIVSFYIVLFVVESIMLAVALPFLFPLCARYDNTIINTVKNSFLLAVSNFGSWLKIALAWFAPITLTLIYPETFVYIWYLWVFVIFALIAFGTSFTLRKVFNRITIAQEANEARQEKEKEKAAYNKKSLKERMAQFDKKDENK